MNCQGAHCNRKWWYLDHHKSHSFRPQICWFIYLFFFHDGKFISRLMMLPSIFSTAIKSFNNLSMSTADCNPAAPQWSTHRHLSPARPWDRDGLASSSAPLWLPPPEFRTPSPPAGSQGLWCPRSPFGRRPPQSARPFWGLLDKAWQPVYPFNVF